MGDPKLALAAREKELEGMIAQDQKELDRVEAQHDAQGKPFASAIKTLKENIERHMKERDNIIEQLNEISMREYHQQQSGQMGGGQTR
jgi:predicted  nucleic acid-binding Zn-ribbon protein